MRIYAYIVIALAVAGLLYGAHDHVYDSGGDDREASIRADLAAEREKADKEAKDQREIDEQDQRNLSSDLASLRSKYAELESRPPIVTVKVKEVPIHVGQTTCPVESLSDSFFVQYNAYSGVQAGAGKAD